MNILDNIVAHKRIEVARKKLLRPVKTLKASTCFLRETISLRQALSQPHGCGVIAEFKRKSPSKGIINNNATITTTTQGYHDAGASGLSILTDSLFFGGSNEDLQEARRNSTCPILRKDFIIEEYQVLEARAIGADAILLIAAILSKAAVKHLTDLATGLGMEVILEVHTKEELDHLNPNVTVVGVNNRNLKTFISNSSQSLDLLPFIPSGYLKIAESGISSPDIAFSLKAAGFDGFLIGEQFMKHTIPEQACASFISTLKKMIYEN